jgi:hypothetical protein
MGNVNVHESTKKDWDWEWTSLSYKEVSHQSLTTPITPEVLEKESMLNAQKKMGGSKPDWIDYKTQELLLVSEHEHVDLDSFFSKVKKLPAMQCSSPAKVFEFLCFGFCVFGFLCF